MFDALFSVFSEAIAKGKTSYKVPKPGDLIKKEKKKPKKPVKKSGLKGKTPAEKVPAQLRHCVVAVHSARRKGKKRHSVRAAWNICRWAMVRNGYLKAPYKINQRLKNVKQTRKGARASMKHSMEPEAPGKAKRFQDLFRDIEKKVV